MNFLEGWRTKPLPVAMTGKEICALMRKHKVTIRGVAKRFGCGVTLKRVREVRKNGVTGTAMVQDWLECLTQSGLFGKKVQLPDGYTGDTAWFFVDPIETDGELVKLRCADPGREYCIAWKRASELKAAQGAQQQQ